MRFMRRALESVTLVSSLTQRATNGLGTLGTLDSPTYPPFLTKDTPLPMGKPWGNRTVEGTNPYTNVPNTGVVRSYDLTIERGFIAPDGVNRSVILINGQFPGPLIEANWGDTIQVRVTNNIVDPEEGTSLHWHGLDQKRTPWEDGVPSVSQCPIAPNKSFTYSFQASNFGTGWYHSHYSAQYAGGLFGPMTIYGPVQKTVKYDYDLGPVILSDWYHHPYFSIVEDAMSTNASVRTIFSDNNLIQGKGIYDFSLPLPEGSTCTPTAGFAKFKVEKGKKYRMRLINTSGEAVQKFTIDGHNLTIFANDYVPIQPYNTNVVTLGVGQRTDIVVEMNGSQEAYWMRSNISATLSNAAIPNQRLGLAAIYYNGANTSLTPQSQPQQWTETPGNDNLDLTQPVYAIPAAPEADVTFNILMDRYTNSSGNLLWHMNGSSFRANYDHPLLLLANQGNTSYPHDPQWNVHNAGDAETIRLILRGTAPFSHPLHLHGHDFLVLAEGVGEWDGTIVRPQNPARRDTQLFLKGGAQNATTVEDQVYLILQYTADNPGVWPFHCHIAWHVSQGLYVNLMEKPDQITESQIPGIVAQTCRDWWQYSGHNIVDQIDSGL